MHVHGDAPAGDVLENRLELGGVQHPLVDVGENLNPLEAQLVDAAVHLGDGTLGAAKTNATPTQELVRIAGNQAGQMVVDA